jgi:hydroxypyruvate isomerase
MTKGILDANPYWTRHFVRTQLEKNGVGLALINTIIGHEKARQEGLGRFSSLSKAKIKSVGEAFEYIARMLELDNIHNNGLQHYTEVNHAH